MNRIRDGDYEQAMLMLGNGASIRQVSEAVGLSRETVHRIQKYNHCADIAIGGTTRVFTGRKANGTLSYYDTKELQPQWRHQHYGDETDFY